MGTSLESVEFEWKFDCFKAYDIRGQIPNQLNADMAQMYLDEGGYFWNSGKSPGRRGWF